MIGQINSFVKRLNLLYQQLVLVFLYETVLICSFYKHEHGQAGSVAEWSKALLLREKISGYSTISEIPSGPGNHEGI